MISRIFVIGLVLFNTLFAENEPDLMKLSFNWQPKNEVRSQVSIGFLADENKLFAIDLVNVGYSYIDNKVYVPLELAVPWVFYGSGAYLGKEHGIPLVVTGIILNSLANFNVSLQYMYVQPYFSHRFEAYVGNWGMSETLSLGITFWKVDLGLYKRFATVDAMNQWGIRLGVFFSKSPESIW
ncbi:MAG: hypothetical protein OCC49_09920 [Fibrobacterales bacterium]